jgi:hypothetical protein
MPERKFVNSFGELIDRLTICQQKELHIPEKRETFTQQINDIVSDLDSICKEKNIMLTGELIQAIVCLTQANINIWNNENSVRLGIDGYNDLELTHSLNTLRTQIYSLLSQLVGDRGEYKINTLNPRPEWTPSLIANKK